MNATARTITVLTAMTSCVWASSALATSPWVASEFGLATVVVAQASPSGGSSPTDKLRQANDLLARARQAMRENQLTVAEQLIAQAESLGAEHNSLNPLADTPTKARRDLERKRAGLSGLPFGKNANQAPAPDPFAQQSIATRPAGEIELSDQGGQPVTHLPNVAANASTGFAAAQGIPGASSPQPADTAARTASDQLLLGSRRALAMGDVRRAAAMAEQAKTYRVAYGAREDNPHLVESAIVKYRDLVAEQAARQNTEAYRRQFARLMMEQSEALLGWRDFNEAERLANQARAQRVNYGPLEADPDTLLRRIADARRQGHNPMQDAAVAGSSPVALSGPSLAAKQNVLQLLRDARAAYAAGDLAAADAYARAAIAMQVPESAFAPNEDRPGMVLLEIQKARAAGPSGVIQASAIEVTQAGGPVPQPQASAAVYDQAQDRTRTIQAQAAGEHAAPRQLNAAQNAAPASPGATNVKPSAGANAGMNLFQQGEAALKAKNLPLALQYYRQASQYRNQLDAATAQQLDERMQLIATPAAGQAPEAAPTPPTLAGDTAAQQQLLARQVNADVAHQERRAAQLRESDPATAISLLEQAKGRVEAAGLEPAARAAILRRVDRNIAEMRQFIEDNRGQLELNQKNKETYADVDREKKYKVEVQEKMAMLVDQFNRMIDEQRYAEAEVVAKQAADLEPNNPIATQLVLQSKFIRRVMNEASVADQKERGFVDALASVDRASVPFNDNDPYRFPDPTKWNELTASRAKLQKDQGRRRSEREIEIEQKLKTPVSLRFDAAPLSTVLDHLAQLAEVNLHLDPQGLQEEGVDTNTPVTINLRADISLKSALNLILQPLHLSYVIKDEVLKVTSEQYRDSELVTVTYSVADLVVPIPNFTPNSRMGLAGAYNDAMGRNGFNNASFGGGNAPMGVLADNSLPRNSTINSAVLAQMSRQTSAAAGGGPDQNMPTGFGPGGLGGGANADFDSLIDLITTTIKPQSWDEVGGPGSIAPFETNLTLVVSQTQEVQEDIVDLLEQLRRLQDLQVTIEVRFITLNDNFFERIGVDFDFNIDSNVTGANVHFPETTTTDTNTTDTTTTTLTPEQADLDSDRSVTIGMTAPGVFAADLDVPFTQNSFGLAVPQFGGFDAAAGASMGFAILSDIEAFFFINAAQGDRRTNVLQAPKVHALQRPAGVRLRHVAKPVRHECYSRRRRLRRGAAAGDSDSIRGHVPHGPGRCVQRSAVRASDGRPVLQPDRRRQHVHLYRRNNDHVGHFDRG